MATRKILVIDDSRVIRNMVRDMLPPENIEVVEAADGVRGLEVLQQEEPWLIMLDFLLPRLSGYEVYEHLQQDRRLSCIPLVLMSGRKEEVTSKIPEPFDDKFFSFVEKPFEQKELLAAIKKAVELAKNKSRLAPVAHHEEGEGVAVAAADRHLIERIAKLEERMAASEAAFEKIKVLEQQVVIQHKQIQQLVAFIKQKLK